ncbi:MAG: hypothetical protein FJ308_19700, partial [Planctomycetes bacterium]|nr:hypothetical protein [Planctomycetota bacterium]
MACNTFIRSGFHGFGIPRSSLMLKCIALIAIGSMWVGCSPESGSDQPQSGKSSGVKAGVDGRKADKRSAAGLPPLKIALVESPQLESELSLRWQTVSDQGLQIVKMSRAELMAGEVSTVDGIIFQANLMGTLSDRGWIAPVPAQVLQKLNENASSRNEPTDEEALGGSSDPMVTWPSRWRSVSIFG